MDQFTERILQCCGGWGKGTIPSLLQDYSIPAPPCGLFQRGGYRCRCELLLDALAPPLAEMGPQMSL